MARPRILSDEERRERQRACNRRCAAERYAKNKFDPEWREKYNAYHREKQRAVSPEQRARRNARALQRYYAKVQPQLVKRPHSLSPICPTCGGPRILREPPSGDKYWFCRPCKLAQDKQRRAAIRINDPERWAAELEKLKLMRQQQEERLRNDPAARKELRARVNAWKLQVGRVQCTREEFQQRSQQRRQEREAEWEAKRAARQSPELQLQRSLMHWLRREMRSKPFAYRMGLTAEEKQEIKREYKRIANRKGRKELALSAVKEKIRKNGLLKISQIPIEYVQAYRAYLLVRRQVIDKGDRA